MWNCSNYMRFMCENPIQLDRTLIVRFLDCFVVALYVFLNVILSMQYIQIGVSQEVLKYYEAISINFTIILFKFWLDNTQYPILIYQFFRHVSVSFAIFLNDGYGWINAGLETIFSIFCIYLYRINYHTYIRNVLQSYSRVSNFKTNRKCNRKKIQMKLFRLNANCQSIPDIGIIQWC